MAKSKYEEWLQPESLLLLEGWRRDGLTYEQIAHNMGINTSTLYKYINEHEEISNALKKGSEVSTYEVENALYKSALGYYVEEMDVTETATPEGVISTTRRKHKRYIAPNIAAQIFILKNRRKDFWKDKIDINEATGETPDDGFIKALNGTVQEDWQDETK